MVSVTVSGENMVFRVGDVINVSLLREILDFERTVLVDFVEQSLESLTGVDEGSIIDIKV